MHKARAGIELAEPQATKLQTIITLLSRPNGALLNELVSATSWQKHSVRGAISGALKKKHKLQISSTLIKGRGRVYRIEPGQPAPIASSDNDGLGGQS
ncbi:DUF3489 domain-containing protein [Devosia ginsengisoli]|uniref:DUF3489 domain-containing protein n=1 Tax=Devosia ginsengisoli TaxID=400770 RepID=UPI0026EF7491|nr:DUF3489 domain-containing protein [Devosia ginsengisoli]MCR6670740.1 DUF3489 domain-containing protein [Devosia ginsengisoli]